MLKGIVFDLDGTLVDSLGLTFDAFNHGIAACGVRTHTRREISALFGTEELQIFSKIVGPAKAPTALNACRTYFVENIQQIQVHDGVHELLDSLDHLNIDYGIFTGRGKDTTDLILKHYRWSDRFSAIATNDHVDHSKPAPHGLLLSTHRMGLKLKEVLYVGDSVVDILSARSARVISVAALWDENSTHERVTSYNPDFCAKKPSDILNIFNKLNQNRKGGDGVRPSPPSGNSIPI